MALNFLPFYFRKSYISAFYKCHNIFCAGHIVTSSFGAVLLCYKKMRPHKSMLLCVLFLYYVETLKTNTSMKIYTKPQVNYTFKEGTPSVGHVSENNPDHHHHLSLNCEGHFGTTDNFTTSLLHFFLFSTAF